MKIKNKIQFVRIIVLISFLIIVTVAAALHQIVGGGPAGAPAIDALCPFGGLETIYKYIADGEFLKRTNVSNFILLGGTIVLAIVAGRFFCGWICMLGFLQEIFGKIGQKIFGKKFHLPEKADRYLRKIKYAVLFIVIILTWQIGELIIRPYDPFAAYAHLPAGFEVFEDFLIGFIILIASLILSMFFDRFFCKYACPMGAFLAIVNRLGIYRIKRTADTCIACKRCDAICPAEINISTANRVASSECFNCLQCVTTCPTKKDTLKPLIMNTFVRASKIVVIGLTIYIGLIGITYITGIWKATESEVSGKTLKPENIRGYMKLSDVAVKFKLDESKLYERLGITREQFPATTTMHELASQTKKTANPVSETKFRNTVKEMVEENQSGSRELTK